MSSNRRYIGQTVTTFSRRKKRHFYLANKHNRYFYNALLKYPDEGEWEWSVLAENIEEGIELDAAEKFFIAFWRSDEHEHGFNMTKGGEGGRPNAETRKKMSEAKKGKKLPAEHCANISKGGTGKPHPNHKGHVPWNKGLTKVDDLRVKGGRPRKAA